MTVLDQAPCDVALLAGVADAGSTGPIVTPFGGIDHDWSAIELAAWLARSLGTTLRLVGTEADDDTAAATPAGYSPAPRFSSSSWSASSPSRSSSPRARTAFSKQRPTRGSRDRPLRPLANGRTSAPHEPPSPLPPSARPSSSGAAFGPAGIAPSETLTRFTWTLGST